METVATSVFACKNRFIEAVNASPCPSDGYMM